MAHTYLPDMMYYLLSSSDMIPFLSTLKKKKSKPAEAHTCLAACIYLLVCISERLSFIRLILFLAWVWFALYGLFTGNEPYVYVLMMISFLFLFPIGTWWRFFLWVADTMMELEVTILVRSYRLGH